MDQQGVKSNLAHLPRRSLHRLADLQSSALLPDPHDKALVQLAERYTIAITPQMVDAIDTQNLATDPIARQFIPDARELRILPEEESDPIGDYKHSPVKGLVHRHPDRVLLKPTQACAVYCRFCFRREMVGPHGDTISASDIEEALAYIADHTEIKEVILTGGDPFVLSAVRLKDLLSRLYAMDHIKWIRVHTRVPVVQPDKIDAAFLQALKGPKPLVISLHINHVRELTDDAKYAIAQLNKQGHMLVSQSVLLKNINDNVTALADLMNGLMENHIKPYYLHHTDLTRGTSHFRVSLATGLSLMKQLRPLVSGLCMPDYVIDIPGGVAKIPVNSDHVQPIADQDHAYWLVAPDGTTYFYQDIAA
ncbi:MAG TPA: lysine-2,3-aminomutase-like protein [Alphaproteobacteria bacterium]